MNFGGGALEGDKDQRKTRKEIFEEIIDKSKAYKMVRTEIKMAAQELTSKLDDEYMDLLQLMNLNKSQQRVPKDTNLDKSYEQFASMMVDKKKALPTQVLQTEHEQAKSKKAQLKEMQQKTAGKRFAEDEDEDEVPERKRDAKAKDKREQAVERVQKEAISKYKNDIKASIAEDQVKANIKKLQEQSKRKREEVDSDLASEEEDDDYDEEDEDDDYGDEEGEEENEGSDQEESEESS